MFDPDRYVAALRFAAERHHGQRMLGSELPYLVHLTSVAAEVLAALPIAGVDADVAVACALLHDAIEDTAKTQADKAELAAEIRARFGDAVADGALALTKDEGLADAAMADSLRRIREQPHAVWIVKLADRITNLTPPLPAHWDAAKRRAYRAEAQQIADALGAASPTLDARIRAKIAAYPE